MLDDQKARMLLGWGKGCGILRYLLGHRWTLRTLLAFNAIALCLPSAFRDIALELDLVLAIVATTSFLGQTVCLKYALDWHFRPGGQYDQEEAIAVGSSN